ncbi:hypothetical protein [Paludibacter jiangxiensis]|uniref:DUF4488 domain-containing protein n=1 Tax=Paludibacter jiangxiensis TaxID=681398 RepID=A0A161LI65_9BACT|nr:hypothetical protein [Paludibacter jiangxiensis]GAT62016.1 hypothetical protein PJIAN_1606 [Paludibacter jiangxiensis]
MRKSILILLLLNALCLMAQNSKLQIENNWINLTKQKGKYVLLYPCYSEISQIKINWEQKTITINYGQEDDVFKILNSKKVSDKEQEFNVLYSTFGNPRETVVKVKFTNLEKKIAEWSFTLTDDSGNELKNIYTMIPVQMSRYYQKIKEPCNGGM